MTRRVITSQLQAGGPSVDSFVDRLLKYIPADVVGGWIAVTGLLSTLNPAPSALVWGLFVIFVVFAFAWTFRQTKLPGEPTAKKQIIIAGLAFVVWVFALGGPFAGFSWWSSALGSIALIVFTLAAPLVEPV